MLLTKEQYELKLKERNPNLQLLSDYNGYRNDVTVECRICGYVRTTMAENLVGKNPRICPKCSGKLKLTHNEYIADIERIHKGKIIVLGKYKNKTTKILHKCTICDYEWDCMPIKLTAPSGVTGCPKCSGNLIKSHTKYINELKEHNIPLLPLEKYINTHTPILHKCTNCNSERYCSPHNVLSGRICPVCNASKGESFISCYLQKNNIEYIAQHRFIDCVDKKPLPFDFYLPFYNVVVEYDGELHYEAVDYFGGDDKLKYTQNHDNIKNDYCKEHNIKLIRIPYWDFDNIEEILNRELEVV